MRIKIFYLLTCYSGVSQFVVSKMELGLDSFKTWLFHHDGAYSSNCIVSRVLRDSIPRYVDPSVGRLFVCSFVRLFVRSFYFFPFSMVI